MTVLKKVAKEDLADGLYVYSWAPGWRDVVKISNRLIYFNDNAELLSEYEGKFYGPIELEE